jgi:hypothetical protein
MVRGVFETEGNYKRTGEEDSKKTARQLMSIESFLCFGMTVAIDFLSVLRVSQKEDVYLDL